MKHGNAGGTVEVLILGKLNFHGKTIMEKLASYSKYNIYLCTCQRTEKKCLISAPQNIPISTY